METEKIKVLIKEPGKDAREEEIDSDLASLQSIVGGYIQILNSLYWDEEGRILIIVNEEGKLYHMPFNFVLVDDKRMPLDMVVGTAIIAGNTEDGEDICSLTDELIEKSLKHLDKIKYIEPIFY